MDAPVLGSEAVIRVEHRPSPCPARPQLLTLGLQLLDGKPADQRRVIHEPLVSGAEEIAPDGAPGGLAGGETDERPKTRVHGYGPLGEKTPHRMRGDIRLGLDLAPNGELALFIDPKGESRHHLEGDRTRPEFIEQLARHLAEPETLLDVPLRYAKAGGDGLDRLARVYQTRHRDELVCRVHHRANRVLHQRGFESLLELLDQAGDLVISGDDTLGGELLQRPETPAASGDGVQALFVGGGQQGSASARTP